MFNGKWLPEEGRYENLKRGQWSWWDAFGCEHLWSHKFVDPRIIPEAIRKYPQTEEKCIYCGYERNI